jgi:NADP-dependent aldehyde dehydrogenase
MDNDEMDGSFLIGARNVTRPTSFAAIAAATGESFAPEFAIATLDDVEDACSLADVAFDAFRDTPPDIRARFLEAIAVNLESSGEALVARAMQETGLPQARLAGELGRTCGQLRMFAAILREGNWAQVTFDTPIPERSPLPRPDLRQRRIAVGPVVVFGASNFPLAFSVAGGDTASALTAGCPVIVKAHSAHPGTSLIAGRAIQAAVASCGLPEGVFSLIQGTDRALGTGLVADPRVKAVGFTGSRGGGMALVRVAQSRPEPIPVYAEMSSINPVVLMPAALAARAEALGAAFVGSLTMGAGQFCTNPGIVFALAGPDLDRFAEAASAALSTAAAQTMLTPGICGSYTQGVAQIAAQSDVVTLAEGLAGTGHQGRAALFRTNGKTFASNPHLSEEVFGAASLIVACGSLDEVRACIAGMEGQLTATLHLDEGDHAAAAPFVPLLEKKAGRILVNGWPTGVEVSRAMVHGGPFPSTSDPRTTSVGAAAIERFLRPVCYQALPEALLPDAVKTTNPWNLPRAIYD